MEKFPICELTTDELKVYRTFNLLDIEECSAGIALELKYIRVAEGRAVCAQKINRYLDLKAALEASNAEITVELEKRGV